MSSINKLKVYLQKVNSIDEEILKKKNIIIDLLKNEKVEKIIAFYDSLNVQQKYIFFEVCDNPLFIDYFMNMNNIYELQKRRCLLLENIYNDNFIFDTSRESFFVLDGEDILEVLSGKSTKDYNLTLKEVKFVGEIILFNQNYDYREFNKSDLFTIKVLITKYNSADEVAKRLKKIKNKEQSLVDTKDVEHLLWKRNIQEVKVLESVMPSSYVAYQAVRCAYYELLIISGLSIDEITKDLIFKKNNKVIDEYTYNLEFDFLTMAYNNLLDDNFKVSSKYFKSQIDALDSSYECNNIDVNKRLLELRLRR